MVNRTVETVDGAVVVAYPRSWSKGEAWRHLLANKPPGVKRPLGASLQLWAAQHTDAAWSWRARSV